MRLITEHQSNPVNEKLKVEVTDEPGPGGANHAYRITGFTAEGEPEGSGYLNIVFQNGPIAEVGVNGVTQEVLLAIIIDRLRSFQAGPFANDFNAGALAHCEAALTELKNRTAERTSRGVEGTMQQ